MRVRTAPATDRADGSRAPKASASGARWPGRACLALVALALGCAVWAFWLEPRRLVFRELSLDVPRWPAELGGLRLALISDLHIGSPYWDLERLARLIAETNRRQPDLVLLAGDYLIDGVKFGSWVDPEAIARELGAVQAPLGTVAVLGNHDWWNDGVRVRRALESQGILVLENQAYAFTHAGREFYVVGVGDPLTGHAAVPEALAQVPPAAPFLVLVHGPDAFPAIDERASLTLAGHTHGGQVCLPWIGCPIVPSSYGQRFVAGHVVEGGRHLFITSGVGTSIFPVRFGVPPEVVLLRLR
ncbi:MAG: metallophosphoesterase [Deltaproteobacteria bacterium]